MNSLQNCFPIVWPLSYMGLFFIYQLYFYLKVFYKLIFNFIKIITSRIYTKTQFTFLVCSLNVDPKDKIIINVNPRQTFPISCNKISNLTLIKLKQYEIKIYIERFVTFKTWLWIFYILKLAFLLFFILFFKYLT